MGIESQISWYQGMIRTVLVNRKHTSDISLLKNGVDQMEAQQQSIIDFLKQAHIIPYALDLEEHMHSLDTELCLSLSSYDQ